MVMFQKPPSEYSLFIFKNKYVRKKSMQIDFKFQINLKLSFHQIRFKFILFNDY